MTRVEKNNFFFIHVYKNMGTTIYNCLPKDYNRKFYGQKTLSQWEDENHQLLNSNWDKNKKFAIDHVRINDLLNLGILTENDLKKRKFIALVREPISRFFSICNFEKKSPKQLIESFEIRNNGLLQHAFIDTGKDLDLTLILMKRKDLIQKCFSNFNININTNKRLNKSNKTYFSLTSEEKNQVKKFFEKDFKLYDALEKNNGIINLKTYNDLITIIR